MKSSINVVAGILTLLATCSGQAWADAEECQNAVQSYNNATNDIAYTLKRYANCISGSQGNDDCDSEFRRLKSSQDDFETAVSAYQSECD